MDRAVLRHWLVPPETDAAKFPCCCSTVVIHQRLELALKRVLVATQWLGVVEDKVLAKDRQFPATTPGLRSGYGIDALLGYLGEG